MVDELALKKYILLALIFIFNLATLAMILVGTLDKFAGWAIGTFAGLSCGIFIYLIILQLRGIKC